ncbi:hypothetical protein SARC_17475, partial [Sphaeroforma arctica JP610]
AIYEHDGYVYDATIVEILPKRADLSRSIKVKFEEYDNEEVLDAMDVYPRVTTKELAIGSLVKLNREAEGIAGTMLDCIVDYVNNETRTVDITLLPEGNVDRSCIHLVYGLIQSYHILF